MNTVTPDPRRWWALALLCGAFFMVILDAAIVRRRAAVDRGRPRLLRQGLQWVLSAYALTFGGLLLLGGRAADLLGRRRVFMAGLAPLHDRLAAVRTRLVARRADRGARAPGRRRGDHDPDRAVDHLHDVPGGPERNKALGIWGALGGIGATAAG